MDFRNQPARIRTEDNGCTIVHSGSTYPPNKVSFSSPATGMMLEKLPQGEYQDAIISGTRNSGTEEIAVTSIQLC